VLDFGAVGGRGVLLAGMAALGSAARRAFSTTTAARVASARLTASSTLLRLVLSGRGAALERRFELLARALLVRRARFGLGELGAQAIDLRGLLGDARRIARGVGLELLERVGEAHALALGGNGGGVGLGACRRRSPGSSTGAGSAAGVADGRSLACRRTASMSDASSRSGCSRPRTSRSVNARGMRVTSTRLASAVAPR
jgi:hypothetical protein